MMYISTEASFMDLFCQGLVDGDLIDDYISDWHSSGTSKPLHEYLGMTEEEYECWLYDERCLIPLRRMRLKNVNKN